MVLRRKAVLFNIAISLVCHSSDSVVAVFAWRKQLTLDFALGVLVSSVRYLRNFRSLAIAAGRARFLPAAKPARKRVADRYHAHDLGWRGDVGGDGFAGLL